MKKVLYVDDAKSMRKLIDLVLSKQFDVTMAENGQLGYEEIEKQKFDVIISDINMPVMSGLELLGKLRKHPNSQYTPVLMLTTEASAELKAEGKLLGATGWIVKPFDPEKLASAINRLIN